MLKEIIEESNSIDILFVSDDCPHCISVLDNINALISGALTVVNIDQHIDEVIELLNEPVTPMMVHFENGKERGRAKGLEAILAFDTTTQ